MKIISVLFVALVLLLSACTTAPEPVPAAKDLGPWPDDGWKPPPMHTYAEQIEIMRRGRHICEISKAGPCAGMIRRRTPDDLQIHALPDGTLNVE